mgnify:FL=1
MKRKVSENENCSFNIVLPACSSGESDEKYSRLYIKKAEGCFSLIYIMLYLSLIHI